MTNPFDDESLSFLVLRNDEDQHCIWPVFAGVPDGWTVVMESAPRDEALVFVEENWTDLRPSGLRS